MKIHRECCVYFKHTLISIAQFGGGGGEEEQWGKITEKKEGRKRKTKEDILTLPLSSKE